MTAVAQAPIDAELVRCLLGEQFPQWAELSVRQVLPGGWDNRTFRVGEDLSARLPSADHYVAAVDKEQRWLPVLAPLLPVAIPAPLARGRPGCGFPRPWSVYRWLPGAPARADAIEDLSAFAHDAAGFLGALQAIDANAGPAAGDHSFGRGGPLARYDDETRSTAAAQRHRVDLAAVLAVWDAALAAPHRAAPVWVHGDMTASNLLVRDGRLSAVIDFGTCAVGDPACDLVLAWTLLSGASRAEFAATIGADPGTWARARGWALWKALLTLAERDHGAASAQRYGWRCGAAQLITDLVAEHRVTA